MRAAVLALFAAACGGDPAQHEITAPGELLTEDGRLREPGWARRELLRWDPARVHDPDFLRQWDFFTVLDGAAAVNLTLVDLGFVRAATVGVVDLATGEKLDATALAGRSDAFVLSDGLVGSAALTEGGVDTPVLAFTTDAETTEIAIDLADPIFGVPAQGAFTIRRRPAMPYLALATPFAEDPHQFFYELKIPGMSAEGEITIGERTFTFSADEAGAVMDWGRGQWPSEVTWRWAAGAGVVDGVELAFNFGEGFGDPGAATENLVVYGDVPCKVGAVAWTYDAADPAQPWRFVSADGRVDLVLTPIAPEIGGLELGAKFQRVRKGYGRFAGVVVVGDDRRIAVDGLLGFAEEVELSW